MVHPNLDQWYPPCQHGMHRHSSCYTPLGHIYRVFCRFLPRTLLTAEAPGLQTLKQTPWSGMTVHSPNLMVFAFFLTEERRQSHRHTDRWTLPSALSPCYILQYTTYRVYNFMYIPVTEMYCARSVLPTWPVWWTLYSSTTNCSQSRSQGNIQNTSCRF